MDLGELEEAALLDRRGHGLLGGEVVVHPMHLPRTRFARRLWWWLGVCGGVCVEEGEEPVVVVVGIYM